MKKLVIFALSLVPFLSYAQEQDSVNAVRTGSYGSFILNGARQLSDINRQLRGAGLAPMQEVLTGVSLGFINRFADQNSYGVSRVSFAAAADDNANDDQDSRLIVWELFVAGNYDVLPNPNWLIYPYLGFGVNYARLTVSTLISNIDFQSSLNTIEEEEVVQKKYRSSYLPIFGEIGGGIERVLKLNSINMYLGLSGGYRLSTSSPWTYKDVKYFENTAFSTQGWMFELRFRFEINPNPDQKVSRGLYQFFQ